jgi:hypothetical protein
MQVNDSRPIADAFGRKYGIRVTCGARAAK